MRLLAWLLLCASFAVADQTPLERARDLRDVAREALLAGDLDKARTALSEAVVDDFFHPDVWFLIGHVLDRSGEPEAAFLAWEFARRLWPEKVPEYFPADGYGRLKPVPDRSVARLDALRAVIQAGGAPPEALREAASVSVALSRWEDARGYLSSLEDAGQATPEDWLAHLQVLRCLNDEASARTLLAKALEATSRAPALVAQQGANFLSDGKAEEAGRTVDEALAAHPDDPTLWQCAGQVRLAASDWEGARDAFAKAVAADPALPGVWARIAALDEEKLDDLDGTFHAAYQAYRRAPNGREGKDGPFAEERMHRALDGISAKRVAAIEDAGAASRLLDEKNPFRRMEGLAWFSSRPPAEAVPALRRGLSDQVAEVRMAAIQGLVGKADPEALGAFVGGLEDPRPTVAASCLYGYVLLQGSESLARLRAAVTNEFSVVRYAAYLGLWQMQSDEAQRLLETSLARETDEGLLRMIRLVTGK